MVSKLAKLEKIITTAMEHKKSHLAKQPHQWDAAVLLPLVEVQGEPAFLFEKRSSRPKLATGRYLFSRRAL
jgi:protein-disulfide isomerase-like protein with CxxC motif